MSLVNPHGGGLLKPLLLQGDALKAEQARARSLKQVKVSSREAAERLAHIGDIYRRLTAN